MAGAVPAPPTALGIGANLHLSGKGPARRPVLPNGLKLHAADVLPEGEVNCVAGV